MARQLVTCPVCKTDQHVRKGLICNHTSEGGLRCSGSHEPIRPSIKKIESYIKEQVSLGKFIETPDGITMNRPTIREALIAMSYTEARAGHWVKPIAFQVFTYVETASEWACWFKPADGSPVACMERKKFSDEQEHFGSYLRQLKEFEQWTKKDIYTESNFELGAIDL